MKKVYLGLSVFFLGVLIVLMSATFDSEKKEERVSIQNGEILYKQLCLDCHGDNGKGEGALIGTSLNNQQFLNTFSYEDIYNMIENGRPGTMMTGYYFLEEREKEDLVSFIRNWQMKNLELEAPSVIEGNVEIGKKMYNATCIMCHGVTGSGQLTNATAIANPETLKQMTDQQLWITIAYGREDTRMGPSLIGLEGVKQFEEQEISDIVAYIRSELFEKYDPAESGHGLH